MEGVLVSAQRAGSTISVTVVSNQQGQYRFASAFEPGAYTLRIRVIGYDLEEDRRRHAVTEGGVVVVTANDEPLIRPVSDEALRLEAEADQDGLSAG